VIGCEMIAKFYKDTVQFLHEVKVELGKVIWPKFDELVGSTIVVLLLVCVFAVYLGVLDFGFEALAVYIFKHYGF
jgi:preprotein translocase subunit SecE